MYSLSNILSLSVFSKQGGKLAIPLLVLLTIYFFPLSAQAQYGGGSGTENDPYLIYTAEQMNEIGADSGDWNKHFKLMNNIDMSDYAGFEYNIIGTSAFESFGGVFDGNGNTISNLSLTSTRDWYTGLFGYVQGQIKNLGLINPNIFSQGSGVGPLIGYLDQGTVINCYAKGVSVLGDSNIGGLVGLCSGRVDNCYSSGSVFGSTYVGGLVGRIGDGTVNKSYSTASVEGNQDVGGLVGKTSEETSVISSCYATGSVSGNRYVGGLVGQVERGAAHKCFSAGSVEGNLNVGGLAGYLRVLGQISHCFWDTQTSGQLTSAGGTGKTTEEMQMFNTYSSAGWDFTYTWDICAGTNYPVLQWQIPICDFLCPDGVNFIDFAFFASHWLDEMCNPANSYCEGTDLSRSGSVDLNDLDIFTDHWLEGIR